MDVVLSRVYIVGNRDLSPEEVSEGNINGDKLLDIVDVLEKGNCWLDGL